MSAKRFRSGAAALAVCAFTLLFGASATFFATPGFHRAATQAPPPSNWTRLDPTGPSPLPRGFHGADGGYDPVSNRLIIFGGTYRDGGEFSTLGDVWVLTNANGQSGPSQWINLITGGPTPSRGGHTAVYDPGSNRLIVFGGCIGFCQVLNDVWVLSDANGLGGTPVWQRLFPAGTGPSGRVHATAVYDAFSNRMIVFGGQNGGGDNCGTFGETWVLSNANGLGDPPAWSRLATAGGPPAGQYGPSGTYIPGTNQLVVFGGWGMVEGTCQKTSATWVLSNANGQGGLQAWTNLVPEGAAGAVPVRAMEEAVAYDPVSDRLISHQNDAWRLSHASGAGGSPRWMHMLPNGPGPTIDSDGVSAYDSVNDVLMMFSGTYSNEVWILNGAARGNSNAPGPAISAVATSTITGHDATVTWTTDQESDSTVEYGPATDYGSTASLGDLVTSHSLWLSGLTPDTLYHYRVTSTNDDDGHASTSADFSFRTAAPPAITAGPTVSDVTGTTARITWTTDQPANSVVHYLALDTAQVAVVDTLVTSHDVVLTSLVPGATYHFDVSSTNDAALTTTSGDHTFSTVPAPPAIANVTATNVTGTGATITWATDQPADSLVEYGVLPAVDRSTGPDGALVTSHSKVLTGLTPGTVYLYRVTSVGGDGASTTSEESAFTTLAPPVISLVTAADITTTSARITWATDRVARSMVDYGIAAASEHSTGDAVFVINHNVALSALTPDTTYVYRVTSAGSDSLATTSGEFTFRTAALPPPPLITALTVSDITSTTARVTWTTDQPSDSTVNCHGRVLTDSALLTQHGMTVTSLTPGFQYICHVSSTNGATPPATATATSAGFSTLRPITIDGVFATSITATSALVHWLTDPDSDSLVEYGPTTAYGPSTSLPGPTVVHLVDLINLTPDTLYHYRVTSTRLDRPAAVSGDFTFRTAAPPLTISNVSASLVTGAGATISWSTDHAADSQIDYGLTSGYGATTAVNSALTIAHAVSLNGLTVGATYHYRVRSTDSAGITGRSGDFTFVSALTLVSMTVSPASVVGSLETASGTITVSGPAGGTNAQRVVTMSSDNPAVVGFAPTPVRVAPAANGVSFTVNTAAVETATMVTIAAAINGTSVTASLLVTPAPTVQSVVMNQSSVVGSQDATGVVTLNGAAAGTSPQRTVTLSSSNPAVVSFPPAGVKFGPGATSAPFTVRTAAVSAETTVTITATAYGTSQSTSLTVRPLPTVAAVLVGPSSVLVGGAEDGVGTVLLTALAIGMPAQRDVLLTSSNPEVATVPASVTVKSGEIERQFTITTHLVPAVGITTISASLNGSTKSAIVLVVVQLPRIASFTVTPDSLIGGIADAEATVTLSWPATGTAAQRRVSLSSDNAAANVPASVVVPVGETVVTFPVKSKPVSAPTTVNIAATINEYPAVSRPLTVSPLRVADLSVSPGSVRGGAGNATVTVTLSAPAVGTVAQRTVSFSSSNPAAATVPPHVVVPAGVTTFTFQATSHAVASDTNVTITAALSGATATTTLVIQR